MNLPKKSREKIIEEELALLALLSRPYLQAASVSEIKSLLPLVNQKLFFELVDHQCDQISHMNPDNSIE